MPRGGSRENFVSNSFVVKIIIIGLSLIVIGWSVGSLLLK